MNEGNKDALAEAHALVAADDRKDFEFAARGFIATLKDPKIRRADGPERIAGEWWRGGGEREAVRDYYGVEDEEGRRFWLFRAGLYRREIPPRWFLHGLFA